MTWADLVWSYPCPDCGAGPGSNCRTVAGGTKAEPHASRVHVIARCRACEQWLHADAADAGVERCDACLAKINRQR